MPDPAGSLPDEVQKLKDAGFPVTAEKIESMIAEKARQIEALAAQGNIIAPSTAPRRLTGHIVNPANDQIVIEVLDEPGSGGACHNYRCRVTTKDGYVLSFLVAFQNGPIAEVGVNGLTHEVLLAILVDRLEYFQKGPYACRENALALTKIQEAQMWLQKRTRDRMARGVEGTHTI